MGVATSSTHESETLLVALLNVRPGMSERGRHAVIGASVVGLVVYMGLYFVVQWLLS